jgi:hypothetical protein
MFFYFINPINSDKESAPPQAPLMRMNSYNIYDRMAPVPAPAATVPISSDDHPSADPSFPHTIRRASIISASNGFLLRESKFVKVEGPRVSVFDAKLCQIGSISDADSF